ncbi:unnamed protein product, partial [Rotaria sp. Silwood2]
QIKNEIEDENDEETNMNIISRLFRSLKYSNKLINERLMLLEHSDPCRLIENLVSKGEYGQALRVCKVFNRTDLADQIHEKALRLSSSQLVSSFEEINSSLQSFSFRSNSFCSIKENFGIKSSYSVNGTVSQISFNIDKRSINNIDGIARSNTSLKPFKCPSYNKIKIK